MTKPTHEEVRIIAYLLGELAESESAELEDQFIANRSLFRQMLAIESELYDAYARNSLAADRRSRFEERFLTRPEGVWRADFSKALAETLDGRRHFPRKTVAWAMAAAACLLIGLLAWQIAPRQQPRGGRTENVSKQPVMVALTLLPGVVRNGGEESTIQLPLNADILRLILDGVARPSGGYRITLRTPEGLQVWTGAVGQSSDTALLVEIPAPLLARGHYIVTLASDPGGEVMDMYAFRVLRP